MNVEIPDALVARLRDLNDTIPYPAETAVGQLIALLPKPHPYQRLLDAGWVQQFDRNYYVRTVGPFNVIVHGQPEGGLVVKVSPQVGIGADRAITYAIDFAKAIEATERPLDTL